MHNLEMQWTYCLWRVVTAEVMPEDMLAGYMYGCKFMNSDCVYCTFDGFIKLA